MFVVDELIDQFLREQNTEASRTHATRIAIFQVPHRIVVANRTIMGKYAASRALKIGGWAATALMAVVVAAMLVTSLGG